MGEVREDAASEGKSEGSKVEKQMNNEGKQHLHINKHTESHLPRTSNYCS